MSAVDMLICVVALQRNLVIYASDPDFETYAGVPPLKLYTITPRG